MYKQLRRAFKVAGCLGAWWQVTNGILQGCPLSTILVNVLTMIWKWEVHAVWEQVCVAMVTLPPVLVAPKADRESDALESQLQLQLQLQAQGPGLSALGALGYANDTQGGDARGGNSPTDRPHDGGLARPHGAGRASGQVLLLVARGGGSVGSFAVRSPHTGGGLFPPGVGMAVGGACSPVVLMPGGWPQCAAEAAPLACLSAQGAGSHHPGDAPGTPRGGRHHGGGPAPAGPGDHGPADGVGGSQALRCQGGGLCVS